MTGIDLAQLQAFEYVVESGSFSAAAVRLNLSQPAVSLRVRQLERRLGVRLVERSGRLVRPTAAGRDLVPHARRIAEAVAEAAAAVAPHSEAVRGRVRLGTGATACIYLLPPLLRDLRRRFPLLEIVVATGNSPEMLRAVEDNSLDVGLVTLPAGGRALAVTPLVEDEIVVLFPATIPAPAAATAAALAELPVLLYETGGQARRLIDDWFRRAAIRLRPAMELGNIEAIKELVGAGLGCGMVLRADKVPDRGLREVIAALRRLGQPG